MTIELSKKAREIICSYPGQDDSTLFELAFVLSFSDYEQIKKAFGESKPEWKINFEPTKKEEELINATKAAIDKAYSE